MTLLYEERRGVPEQVQCSLETWVSGDYVSSGFSSPIQTNTYAGYTQTFERIVIGHRRLPLTLPYIIVSLAYCFVTLIIQRLP